MKHSLFKKGICLLLAAQTLLSVPASMMIEAAAMETYYAEEAAGDAFHMEGVTFEDDGLVPADGESGAIQSSGELPVSYVDIDGSYLAPEKLTVYVTKTLGAEAAEAVPVMNEKYTGVVAFYNYTEDRTRENPFFFYYEEGILQKEETSFVSTEGYLNLVNPPVSATVVDPNAVPAAEGAEEEKVYAAEEVYVEEEAEEHEQYLFAFNQEETDNGLYTGVKNGQVYLNGLVTAAEVPSGTEGESGEEIERAIPVTTAAQQAGGVLVKWTADETATGYRILRKAIGEEFAVVADLTEGDQQSYLDTSAVSNKTYIYAVRSYFGTKTGEEREDESGNLWSGYQASASVFYLAAPAITNHYDVSNGIVVAWEKVDGAENYFVCRRTSDTGWKTLGIVAASQSSFTDTTAAAGTEYLYTIRAQKGGAMSGFFDYTKDPEAYISRHPIPAVTHKSAISEGKSGVLVSWTADNNAAGYRVFRQAKGGSWVVVADISDGSVSTWFDSEAVSGTTYLYTVRAYYGTELTESNADYKTPEWSAYIGSALGLYLAAPAVASIYDVSNGLTVTWNKVSGAEIYYVCRRTADTGWKTLSTVGANVTSYADTTAAQGERYLYTIRAKQGNIMSPFFDYSKEESAYVARHAIPVVTHSNAINEGKSGIMVKWTKDAAATGYRVYRCTDKTSWSVVANIADGAVNTWFDEAPVSGTTYAYTVCTYYGTTPIERNYSYKTRDWSTFLSSAWGVYLNAPVVTCWSDSQGMSLKWDVVAGATGYTVFRKSGTGRWSTIATITGGNTCTYLDKTAEGGKEYSYTVRASANGVMSAFHTPEADTPFRVAPVIKAANTVDNTIEITWPKDEKATGFRVYRRAEGDKAPSIAAEITDGSAVSWIDENVESNKLYVYAVRAYYGSEPMEGNNNFQSNDWSGYAGTNIQCIYVPVLQTVRNVATGVALTWEEVAGTKYYHIYRSPKGEKVSWTYLGRTDGSVLTYIDKTAVNGTEYLYAIRSGIAKNNVNYLSALRAPEKGFTYHASPVVTSASTQTGLQLSWEKDPLATGYRVFRKKAEERSWTTLANVPANVNTYLDDKLASGATYQYTVMGYYGAGDITAGVAYVAEEWSAYIAKTFTFLSTPVFTSEYANNEFGGVKITWKKVVGATEYSIYRKDMSVAKPAWTYIGKVTGGETTVYSDKAALKSGATYYYTVRAHGENSSMSGFDATGVVTMYLPAPTNFSIDSPTSAGTAMKWQAVTGAKEYMIYRKTESGKFEVIGKTTGTSYIDTAVKSDKVMYYYTVRSVSSLTVEKKTYTILGDFTDAETFSIKWSGKERNQWVTKDGNTYYVDSYGYCYTGWHYANRNGSRYRYYFDETTGALSTNLFKTFGKSYRDMKMKLIVYINSSNDNPSYLTIYLYDSNGTKNGCADNYCLPAVSVRCVGNLELTIATKSGSLRKGSSRRWLESPETYEQYATFIRGTDSWFHSALYEQPDPYTYRWSSYNSLAKNKNNTGACIRMQCIYAYLIADIQKNGYGSRNSIPVVIYLNRSNKGPFGVPKIDKIGSRNTDPTDPAVTGRFFYSTSVFSVSASSGAKTWTYY